ncbi:MAG: hypothetical protein AB1625_15935 [Acidobacteriota bacterium]
MAATRFGRVGHRTIGIGLITASLVLAPAPQARAGDAAAGYFQSTRAKLPAVDAYAFHHSASLGEGRAILVAVSNGPFGSAYLDSCWYRKYLIDTYFIDEQTQVVYLEFGLDGSYSGYSYYFGSGDGCGFCGGGEVTSTVKSLDGRLRGKVVKKAENVSFDIELDVPIATDDFGLDQGPGGGEAGRAYQVFHTALADGNAAALKGVLSQAWLSKWLKAEHAGRGDDWFAAIRSDRPKTVTVKRALVRDGRANVLMTGEHELLGAVFGEALLVLEDGAWKVDDETIQIGEESP